MNIKPYTYRADRVCTRCVMDDTVPGIAFDKNGVCTFCHIHDELEAIYPLNDGTSLRLKAIIDKIKEDGKRRNYDCVVGVSGGRDSSYTLYNAVKLGLRPLAVHFDNGWNSDTAVQNIKNITSRLGVDFYTHVADWEEFKDLQKSFLFASVPDGEVPTDWTITSVLYQLAKKEKLRYIIGGNTFRTEGTTPLTWTYQDPKYIKAIQNKFGRNKIKSFPIMGVYRFLNYSIIKQIRWLRLLYFIPYNEKEVLSLLSNNFGWENYGDKHFESVYTKFFQSYILPRKFNIDKRKLHFSARIRSNQMDRDRALKDLLTDPYDGGIELIKYVLKKLDITLEQFEYIMIEEPKNFLDYPSLFKVIKFLKNPLVFFNRVGIVPDVIVKKYFDFSY